MRPGLTGLAQVNGRNSISWAKKLEYDVEYIQNITFIGDLKILLKTFITVFKREGITDTKDTNFDMDLGDFLLKNGEIDKQEYEEKQKAAQELINA